MKAQIKAIMASAVVIALCLAAVGGVTYSWFSDSEDSQIDITAGTINLEASVSSAQVKSYNYNDWKDVTQAGVKTHLGGTVSYDVLSEGATSYIGITFNNAAPGDELKFTANVKLTNTIHVTYSNAYSVYEGATKAVDSPFIISGMTAASENITTVGTTDKPYSINIKMDELAGNEYMGKSYRIVFEFKAIQLNAPPSASNITTVAGQENNVSVSSGAGNSTAQATMVFTPSDAKSLNVEMISGSSTGYTTTYTDETVLAGISVEYSDSSAGSPLDGVSTQITFKIPGVYDKTEINVWHDDDKVINGGTPATGISDVSVANDGYTTTVGFKTTLGFSKYHVTGNFPVACDGKYYKTFDAAVAAATTGSTVKLMKNITGSLTATGDFILDLNGKTINGSLTIDGEGNKLVINDSIGTGKITTYSGPVRIYNDAEVTINGGTFVSNDLGIYVGSYGSGIVTEGGKLTFNNGAVYSKEFSVWVIHGGEATINGGYFEAKDNANVASNGSIGCGPVNVTINGGEFVASITQGNSTTYGAFNVFVSQSGTWNINGGTYTINSFTGGVPFVVRSGVVNIDLDNIDIKMNVTDWSTKYQYGDSTKLSPSATIGAYYSNGKYGFVADPNNASLTIKYNGSTITPTISNHTTEETVYTLNIVNTHIEE